MRLRSLGVGVLSLLSATVLPACSGPPTLSVTPPGEASGVVPLHKSITFGGGPITVKGGTVTLLGDPNWGNAGGVGSGGLVFIRPEENGGQVPGVAVDGQNQFKKTYKGKGLVLRPGERWFYVITAIGNIPGRWTMGDVSLSYRAGDEVKHVTIPTNMTVEVLQQNESG